MKFLLAWALVLFLGSQQAQPKQASDVLCCIGDLIYALFTDSVNCA